VFKKFKIWFIDDLLHTHLENAVGRALGPSGVHADWRVLESATKAIQCFQEGDVPDIALIDMNFNASQEEEAIVGGQEHEDSRGLIVATALVHYAKKKPRYAIYTAYPEVRDRYAVFVDLPTTLPLTPLLRIMVKGDPQQSTVEAVLGWAEEEADAMARECVREHGVSPDVCDQLAEALANIEAGWQSAWEQYQQEFGTAVRPRIIELIEKWKKAAESVHEKEYLPIGRLGRAQSIGEVSYALDQATGDTVRGWVSDLQAQLSQFRQCLRKALEDAADTAQTQANLIANSPAFRDVAPLFPFQAQIIAGSGDNPGAGAPDVLIESLRKMLAVLEEVDHHRALARAFKCLRVPGQRDTVPTTVFAHACHNWSREWQFCISKPTDPGEREKLLREELGLEDNPRVPVLHVPEGTLDRIRKDGLGCCMATPTPFLKFAESGIREHWIECPPQYLQKHLPIDVTVTCSPTGCDVEVLTDWRHFFDPNTGLIHRLLSEERKIQRLAEAHVKYEDEGKTVTIWFTFALENGFYFGPLDLQEPGGGLTGLLRQFLGWGQLIVHSNTCNVCYRTPWPGGKPEDEPGDTSQGRFVLEWRIYNYLKTRCAP